MADAVSRDRGFGSGGWGACPPIAWPPAVWPPSPGAERDNGFAAGNVALFRPAVSPALGHADPEAAIAGLMLVAGSNRNASRPALPAWPG